MDNLEYYDLPGPPAIPPKDCQTGSARIDTINNDVTVPAHRPPDNRPSLPPKNATNRLIYFQSLQQQAAGCDTRDAREVKARETHDIDCGKSSTGDNNREIGCDSHACQQDGPNNNDRSSYSAEQRNNLSLDLKAVHQSAGILKKSPERKISGTDIALKVNKFEMLTINGNCGGGQELLRESPPKNLWFYKDGLRSPTNPPPVSSARMVLSVSRDAESKSHMDLEPDIVLENQEEPVTHISTANIMVTPAVQRKGRRHSPDEEHQMDNNNYVDVSRDLANNRVELASSTGGWKSVSSDNLLGVTGGDCNGGVGARYGHSSSYSKRRPSGGNLMTSSLTALVRPDGVFFDPPAASFRSDASDAHCAAGARQPVSVDSGSLTLTRLSKRSQHGAKPPPPLRTTPVRVTNGSTAAASPLGNGSDVHADLNGGQPPPLPPKQLGESSSAPPRPVSKELKLDDILSMCAEYEKQIEEEQRQAFLENQRRSQSVIESQLAQAGLHEDIDEHQGLDLSISSTSAVSDNFLTCSTPTNAISSHSMLGMPSPYFSAKTSGNSHATSLYDEFASHETPPPTSLPQADSSLDASRGVGDSSGSGMVEPGSSGALQVPASPRETAVTGLTHPPLSPSSTLQQPRIKTNGSLPRDGKRLPSPARSLPPTSPLATPVNSEHFTFDRNIYSYPPSSPLTTTGVGSAAARLSFSSPLPAAADPAGAAGTMASSNTSSGCYGAGVAAPGSSPGCYLTHPTASPRTRIKTIVGGGGNRSASLPPQSPSSAINNSFHQTHNNSFQQHTTALANSSRESSVETVRLAESANYTSNNALNNSDVHGYSSLPLVSRQHSEVGAMAVGSYPLTSEVGEQGYPYHHQLQYYPVTHQQHMINLADFQGGREDMADTEGKTEEELYIEARDMLNLVNGTSPASTGARRPPRSKHDGAGLNDSLPSSEAAHRLIIGTVMLNQNRAQVGQQARGGDLTPLANSRIIDPDVSGDSADLQLNSIRSQRDMTILEVTRTATELAEIEQQIDEANRSVDMESSLLDAELTSSQLNMDAHKKSLAALQLRDAEMLDRLEVWRRSANKEMEAARKRLEAAEIALNELEAERERMENSKDHKSSSTDLAKTVEPSADGADKELSHYDTDQELDILERLKAGHERLEAERRVFEDLEFKQMEEESVLEADREEVLREIQDKEKEVRQMESEIQEIERQKQEITICQDSLLMQDKKELVSHKLKEEQEKLSQLERKLSQLLHNNDPQRASRDSDDSGTITQSDEETVGYRVSNVVSMELLGGGAGNSTLHTTANWARDKLNSAGSGEESTDSTSDLPQDSSSTTPSPNMRRFRKKSSPSPQQNKKLTKRANQHRSSERYLEHLDGLTSADDESRPISTLDLTTNSSCNLDGITDTSSWIAGQPAGPESGLVTLRRNGASSRASRPLTRYLPVTSQENFDLRSHIESAGHQIELCKHIVLNSCACRGYLSKLGARIRVWNKRWFVFDRNKRTLVYYSDKSEAKAKGGIYFHSISEVYVDHQANRSAKEAVTFCMKTQDRKYLLMAPSPEAMRIWVDVLFTGAEGYREFQSD